MAEESSRAWKDQYMLRFPDGMRDRIKTAAEANNRSMNAEIVARLEASLEANLSSPADVARLNHNMEYLIKALSKLEVRFNEVSAGRPDPKLSD